MLDLDAVEARLCPREANSDDDCVMCQRSRLVIAELRTLRAVLADTAVEEVATAPWPEDFLAGVDPSLTPGKLIVLWTLAYLKRKAGVTG